MGRSHVTPIQQPTNYTCGPSSLKTALHVLGIHRSLPTLIKLCKTSRRNGTATKNLIAAMNGLGLSVLAVEYADLRHIISSLHYPKNKVRAVMVSYLYDLDEKNRPHPDSGHWATVSSYFASKSRIVLFDSATGKRKSYDWAEFRERWMDFDYKRRKLKRRGRKFRLIRHWQPQLLLVIAKNKNYLPTFRIETSELFLPS